MSFWQPHYSPQSPNNNHQQNNQSDNQLDNQSDNQPNNQTYQSNGQFTEQELAELQKQLLLPPNITALPTGRFRAYKSRSGSRVYLGTYDTIDEAVSAQNTYLLTGQIPERERLSRNNLSLKELIKTFIESNE